MLSTQWVQQQSASRKTRELYHYFVDSIPIKTKNLFSNNIQYFHQNMWQRSQLINPTRQQQIRVGVSALSFISTKLRVCFLGYDDATTRFYFYEQWLNIFSENVRSAPKQSLIKTGVRSLELIYRIVDKLNGLFYKCTKFF